MAIRMTRPMRRTSGAIVVALAAALASPAYAQAPAPPPKPAPRPAAPKPGAPKPPAAHQQPAPAPAPAPAPQAQGPAPAEMPKLVYSPWTKLCGKGQEPNAPQVCFTGKDVHTEFGAPAVAVVLIEPEGAPRKLVRITLPLGLSLQHGTRIILDQQQPIGGPYFACLSNGCMADYEATPELIAKMKTGQTLTVQAVTMMNTALSFPLPLADFAKANEGPPTDPKVFEEQQKKVQEELQKKAEELRKKLEQQGGAPKQ